MVELARLGKLPVCLLAGNLPLVDSFEEVDVSDEDMGGDAVPEPDLLGNRVL